MSIIGKQTATGGKEEIRAPTALLWPAVNMCGLRTPAGMARHAGTLVVPLRTTSQGGTDPRQWETIVPKPYLQAEAKLQSSSMKML